MIIVGGVALEGGLKGNIIPFYSLPKEKKKATRL